MEKAFAYVCTASDAAPRLLKRYCRKIYELGYVPILPEIVGQPVSGTGKTPMKKGNFKTLPARSWDDAECWWSAARRSAIPMSAEIGMAEKRNLICTTLDGLAKIKEADE